MTKWHLECVKFDFQLWIQRRRWVLAVLVLWWIGVWYSLITSSASVCFSYPFGECVLRASLSRVPCVRKFSLRSQPSEMHKCFFRICEAVTGESTRAAACAIGKAGAALFCVILVYLKIFQANPFWSIYVVSNIFQSRHHVLRCTTPTHDFGMLSRVASMLATD